MLTIRISFEKRAEAAFISLLDLQRIFQRILKRSGLPVYYTQGFNPHIYLSFACPLSLGQESLCESCEVKTADEAPDLEAWQQTLQPYMPHGITITKIAQARQKVTEIAWADYAVTVPAVAAPALAEYAAAEQVIVAKKTKRGRKEIDLKAFLPAIETAPAGEDGNWVVNSGVAHLFGEYDADGVLIRQFDYECTMQGYRTFKYAMDGFWFR